MRNKVLLTILIVILLALAVAPALAAPVAVTVPEQPSEVCAYSIWYRPTCDRYADLAR